MKKRILSAVLTLCMLLSLLPAAAMAEGESVTVDYLAQGYGAFFVAPQTDVKVPADLAESYGYTDNVKDGVSALDVLCKAHEAVFGDDFNADTAPAFLALNDSGWINTIFGVETGNCSYTVNDAMPAEAVNTFKVKDGDALSFFMYQDESALDNYIFFKGADGFATAFAAKPGEPLELEMDGYCIGWRGYGLSLSAAREMAKPIAGMQLATVSESGEVTAIDGVMTDDDGVFTLKFDEAGTYIITADGAETDDNDVPVIMTLATVTVSDKAAEPATLGLSGAKTEYKQGEALDLGQITVSYTDGSEKSLKPEEVTVSGFDADKLGEQTVTVSYGELTATLTVTVSAKAESEAFEKMYTETATYMAKKGAADDWEALALARDGRMSDAAKAAYIAELAKTVDSKINDKNQLSATRASENARTILALTALGADASDVNGHDLTAGFTDINYITRQGVNGAVWALIALDSHDYNSPVSRDKIVKAILASQLPDGGWSYGGDAADADMTAMALCALAPYADDAAVGAAIEKALGVLSAMQSANGGFASGNALNLESTAQVVLALTALGLDPESDARFVKNGLSAIDAMSTLFVPNGGFEHVSGKGLDKLATEQGYLALVAVKRALDGKTAIYDMSDVVISNAEQLGGVPIKELAAEANEKGSATVKAGDATVTLDKAAVAKLNKTAPDANLVIEVSELDTATLGAAERKAIKSLKGAVSYKVTAYLVESGKAPVEVHELGGKATVTVPYAESLEQGMSLNSYYTDESGIVEKLPAQLDGANASFETSHFSHYTLAQSGTDAAPKTGDAGIALYAALAVVSLGGIVLVRRKEEKA